MENQLELFLKIWESFENVVRGALIAEANKNPLTYARAKMVLAKENLSWQNDFASAGHWLSEYEKSEEQKGKEIRRILTEDMKFTEEATPKSMTSAKFVGAAGGGAIGYAIAHMAEFGLLGTTASVVLPMLACYVGGNVYGTSKHQESVKHVIDSYCLQLEAYKNSVIALLNA